jgi:hypothetical protein
MRINISQLLLGVLAGSVIARLYEGFTERIQHENRHLHETLVIIGIMIILLALREN